MLQQIEVVWGAQGGPLSRLCASLTVSLASGFTPGVARRRATMRAWL